MKGFEKVSRGSENKVKYETAKSTLDIIPSLKSEGYHILAIEITDEGILLPDLKNYLKDKRKFVLLQEMRILKLTEQRWRNVIML